MKDVSVASKLMKSLTLVRVVFIPSAVEGPKWALLPKAKGATPHPTDRDGQNKPELLISVE